MKSTTKFVIRILLLLLFCLLWFVLVQVEYEVITKPELRSDFPLVQGMGAVYLLGTIVTFIGLIILYLFYLVIKHLRKNGK